MVCNFFLALNEILHIHFVTSENKLALIKETNIFERRYIPFLRH